MPYSQNIDKIEKNVFTEASFLLLVENFLRYAGLPFYKLEKLNNDCSKRTYYRIYARGKSFILMDSSQEPDAYNNFLKVASFLASGETRCLDLQPSLTEPDEKLRDFHIPYIYATDDNYRLILLEDFGDHSYTNFLIQHPDMETRLYDEAIEVLGRLINHKAPPLPPYDAERMNKELEIFIQWYLAKRINESEVVTVREEMLKNFHNLYFKLDKLPAVLVLLDYHADNLMWLGDKKNKVGLLDFQDALLGSPVYDLVSLLEDARRDLQPETVIRCKKKFAAYLPNVAPEILEESYAILGAQRNLKIIGIFHRQFLRDKKDKYLLHLPRVWQHLKGNLTHPALAPLKTLFDRYALYEF